MTTAKTERLRLQRLGSGSIALLAVHLALPEMPEWADAGR
jgi:hypothetical protein